MTVDPGYGALKSRLISLTGLAYYLERDADFLERIGTRLAELGLPDCAAYSALLEDDRAGRPEMDVMAARLNIGETYFFRDPEQLDAIRDVALPDLLERNQSSRRLRIWSAGCANGSEPYSLAILLERDLNARLLGWNVSVVGTDISPQALKEATEGRYGDWALRTTSDEVRQECFARSGERWAIRPQYRKHVSFAQLNLADESVQPPCEGGKFDLIVCRNVMIYFSAELKARLIRRFRESLANGGWLVVGAVEHDLENFKNFRTVPAPGATLYQRVDERMQPFALKAEPECYRDPAPVVPVPRALREVPRECAAAAAPAPAVARPDLEGLRKLANRGDWHSAVRYCRQLLALDGLNPLVHYYHALVLEQIGGTADAEQSLRRAIYLDRHFLLAHYHLGLVLTKDRKTRPAVRSFENVLTLSSEMHDQQTVADGDGVTVAGLKELARMHLHNLGAL
ncbi:MAG TPA: protein-glutamate O-methyltransferase CheR [Bryobacteraceae bacterium]|jgi:chemotaxis protein methyltransferase CheR